MLKSVLSVQEIPRSIPRRKREKGEAVGGLRLPPTSQLGYTNTQKIEAPWDQLGMGHRLWASELILLFGLSLSSLENYLRKLGVIMHTCSFASWEHEQ